MNRHGPVHWVRIHHKKLASGRRPAVGNRRLSDLCYDVFCQRIGGNEFDPSAVHGCQALLPRVVNERHPRQIHANSRFANTGERVLKTLVQHSHPRPGEASFELERDSCWLLVDRDSHVHFTLTIQAISLAMSITAAKLVGT